MEEVLKLQKQNEQSGGRTEREHILSSEIRSAERKLDGNALEGTS
jgi:hypothetical protein